MVYVNYNLRIRFRQAASYYEPEDDPFDRLMELSLYDEKNPIRDWMDHGRSNAPPLLDEEDTESDTPIPSHLVIRDDSAGQLQRITGTSSLGDWADENVGDTHIGQRKTRSMRKKQKGKKKMKSVEERP